MASGRKKSSSSGSSSSELHKIYRVLPDEEAAGESHLRVVDECGEDHLYPAEWFVALEVPRLAEKSLLGKH